MEMIRAGAEIGVDGFTGGEGLAPAAVKAFELVSVTNTLGNGKT